jgi:hypothetical protein
MQLWTQEKEKLKELQTGKLLTKAVIILQLWYTIVQVQGTQYTPVILPAAVQ